MTYKRPAKATYQDYVECYDELIAITPTATTQGYVEIARVHRGRYFRITQHRLVFQQAMGRQLTHREVVHHINGCKTDNRIENLELLSLSDHAKEHQNGHRLAQFADKARAKYNEWRAANPDWIHPISLRRPKVTLKCVRCYVEFVRPLSQYKKSQKKGHSICCSVTCAGIIGRNLRYGSAAA